MFWIILIVVLVVLATIGHAIGTVSEQSTARSLREIKKQGRSQ